MRPVVDRIKEDYAGQLKVVELNANSDGQEAFEAGNLPGHPAFVIVQPDGQEVWRGFGLVSEVDIYNAIDDALAAESSQ
jgi:hypothetical protein